MCDNNNILVSSLLFSLFFSSIFSLLPLLSILSIACYNLYINFKCFYYIRYGNND